MSASDPAPTWRPSAALPAIAARARMLARLRAFFAARGVLEVETPILSRHGATDPALTSVAVDLGGRPHYLQTSPEFPMKRLLAAGSGPLYQTCKVFRDDERGRRHHPEFTLLEWYRPGFTLAALMDEVADLVRLLLDAEGLPVRHVAYRDLFLDRLGLDPWSASGAERRAVAVRNAVPGAEHLDLHPDAWLDLLLSHCLEPGLGRGCLTFLYGYPPSQAALARIADGPFPAAERFELYLDGMELANGFHELTDAGEQRRRFEQDGAERRARGQADVPMDVELLNALAAGMPDCAGVALGLDRLLMLAVGADCIDDVLTFPIERA